MTAAQEIGFTPPVNVAEAVEKYQEPIATDAASKPNNTTTSEPMKPAIVEAKPKSTIVPEAKSLDSAKVKQLILDGDFDQLMKLVEVNPEGLKVPSSRYAEFRRWEKTEKAKLATVQGQAQTALRAAHEKEREVQELARKAVKDVEGLYEARRAWEAGDIDGMLKAFGTSLEEFTEHATKQRLGQDPRVTALERKLIEKEKAEQQLQEQRKKELEEQTTRQQRAQYCGLLRDELKTSDDPAIVAAVSELQDFSERVMALQLDRYNRTGEELTSFDAASELLSGFRQQHERMTKILGVVASQPQSSDADAITPLNTDLAGKAPATSNRSKAPKPPPRDERKLTWEERKAKLAADLERARREDELASKAKR
jgi:hypothetical protein